MDLTSMRVEANSVIRAAWVCGLLLAGVLVRVFFRRLQTLGRRRKLIASRKCKVPPSYPHKDLLGIDVLKESTEAFRSKTFLARQCSQYDQYGSTFTSRYFTQAIINTIEPENIQSVLETEFSHYGVGWRRIDAFEPLLGKSLFQLDGGHSWASSRGLVKTAFGRAQMTDFSKFEDHVEKLVTGVKQKMREGGQVDLGPFFVEMAVNLTLEFIHGESPNGLSGESSLQDAAFFEAICQAGKGCEERWQLGLLWKLRPQREFYRNVKKVHTYMEKHIDRVRDDKTNKSEGRNDFLATLSRATTDRKVLRDEMCMLFIAGADTLACALTNLFFLLGSDPLVWEKLRREVAFLRGHPPTLKELKGMQYLNSCIHESMRLFPILPNNSRVALQDTVLPVGGGEDGRSPVFVKAGAMVTFSIMALQRSNKQWGMDASEFRPERWENTKVSSSSKFLPFLRGPRSCLGRDLAMNEMGYVLARLVQRFEKLDRIDDDPWVENIAMATTSANGAKVTVVMDEKE